MRQFHFIFDSSTFRILGKRKREHVSGSIPKRLTCDESWACLVNAEGWLQLCKGGICVQRKGWSGLHKKFLYCPPQRGKLPAERDVQLAGTAWSSLFFVFLLFVTLKTLINSKLLGMQGSVGENAGKSGCFKFFSSPSHMKSWTLPQWALKWARSSNSSSIFSILWSQFSHKSKGLRAQSRAEGELVS